jgi:hypothetical protein
MSGKQNILSGGAAIAGRNKRYVVWFWLLNLALASVGGAAFSLHAHTLLDHSLYSSGLVRGFDLGVLFEMLGRPEFGPARASTAPAMMLAVLFFVLTMIFLPGVLQGYASDHRISRAEFFRACGINLWRFVRLTVLFAIVGGIVAGILFAAQNGLIKVADTTSYELLPFYVQLACLLIIFLIMTAMRIWFDLAETSVVLTDQRAVRKSLGSAFRQTRNNLVRLLVNYVVIAIVGLLVLAVGVWLWNVIVPPASVSGAFLISQAILLSLLALRFWQRATAVAFYTRSSVEQPVELSSPVATALPSAVTSEPAQV